MLIIMVLFGLKEDIKAIDSAKRIKENEIEDLNKLRVL